MAVQVDRDWLLNNGVTAEEIDRALASSPATVPTEKPAFSGAKVLTIPGQPHLARAASGPGWWEFEIAHWRPASLNELNGSVRTKIGLKKRDRKVVCDAYRDTGFPAATGRRLVSLTISVPKGQRRWDEDNLHKSLADALKHARAIVNDSPDWIAWGPIDYRRPAELATAIKLFDVPAPSGEAPP